jgi:hypothetical protein
VNQLTNLDEAPSDKTQKFARYEFKYLLNQRAREQIEAEIEHFMTYDGFAHTEHDNSYFVRSLYFDNSWASHYYEKIDGNKTRHKFRLRTYGRSPTPGVPVFLEKKGRHNQRTYKERTSVEAKHIDIFLDENRHVELLELYPDIPLIEGFVFDSIRRNLSPKVLVDYQRRPYTSPFDTNFRLTFDSNLLAFASNRLFPTSAENGFNCVPGWTILEVKFHRRIPAWFHRILQAHDMSRISISKFCVAMEATGQALDLS